MKKIIFLFFLILSVNSAFCQDVVINGVIKNRLLTWDDFTGEPDYNLSYWANTYWKLNYRFGLIMKSDTVKLTGLQVTLSLDGKLSWVKQGKQAPDLLKHEQGHFNIGLICQNEFIKLVNSTVFLRSDFKTKLQEIFTANLNKYIAMGATYDEETDHSKNQEAQEKWNDFFSKELNSRAISF